MAGEDQQEETERVTQTSRSAGGNSPQRNVLFAMSSPPPLPPEQWQPKDGKEQQAKQVSLRGASAREISRDALLQKVSQERELRNYTRRASAAALYIQRIWRRYALMKRVAQQIQVEWETLVFHHDLNTSSGFISGCLLRPFLFFTSHWTLVNRPLLPSDLKCITKCFEIILQSINSSDPNKNFCFLTTGEKMERSTWLFQAQKLISLCSFLLFECDFMTKNEYMTLSSLGTRLAISLTDPTNWKCFNANNIKESGKSFKRLLMHMATGKNSLYISIRKYFSILRANGHGIQGTLHKQLDGTADENFLITATAITLVLRTFHMKNSGFCDLTDLELMLAAEEYCKHILTIPFLVQSLPLVLLPALRHESSLRPCLQVLLISKVKVLADTTKVKKLESSVSMEGIPSVGWLLANITNLSVECNIGSGDSGKFSRGLDLQLYIHVTVSLLETFLNKLDGVKHMTEDNCCKNVDSSQQSEYSNYNSTEVYSEAERTSYLNQLRAVHQQWFLRELIADMEKNVVTGVEKLKLRDVAFFYSYMIRLYCCLSPMVASLPILNILSFTPGFLVLLWKELEKHIYSGNLPGSSYCEVSRDGHYQNTNEKFVQKKQKGRETGDKWFNILQKITGKSTDVDCSDPENESIGPSLTANNAFDICEVQLLKLGCQGVSEDLLALMHLFFAAYSHLLLVLDDIEFYEMQVPFTLEQQQKIANMLNSFVYSSFLHNDQKNKFLMDVAIHCLHLLYERDCRRKFCPASLWVGPAVRGRLPVAAAARAHEAAFVHLRSGDIAGPMMSSVVTTMPHVFPFEERVQMFREFINQDKSSRRVAGEVDGPGPGSIEVVIRRNQIVEDGYGQLNSLGSRLKSSFNVSFVSETGLPEVGLDYGGLSKEFLTDLSKSAFDPQFGLFVQTSTSDRLLIPNVSAKFTENGIDMIEFLGRIVGKALYEGILLDYSFALAFIHKILGRYSFVDELSTLDPELYKNLMYVKHYEGDVEELALDFTVTEDICGKRVTTELKPGGRNVLVTNENKLQYVYALSDYKLNRQMLPLANAFFRGLSDLISPSWLRLFNANEFNELLSGGKHDFDVEDLKNNTKYSGGYSERSRTIKLYWEVVKGFAPQERCMLLKFVTSCSRAPLLGFKYLQPTFTIHKVACDVPLLAMVGGQDVDRLPSASTCYNTLKLPTYKKSSTLRSKLLYAISSNAGFELS